LELESDWESDLELESDLESDWESGWELESDLESCYG